MPPGFLGLLLGARLVAKGTLRGLDFTRFHTEPPGNLAGVLEAKRPVLDPGQDGSSRAGTVHPSLNAVKVKGENNRAKHELKKGHAGSDQIAQSLVATLQPQVARVHARGIHGNESLGSERLILDWRHPQGACG